MGRNTKRLDECSLLFSENLRKIVRYRYLDDFRRGISVFAFFSYGIAVLGTPQCPPPRTDPFYERKVIIMYLIGKSTVSRKIELLTVCIYILQDCDIVPDLC